MLLFAAVALLTCNAVALNIGTDCGEQRNLLPETFLIRITFYEMLSIEMQPYLNGLIFVLFRAFDIKLIEM